VFAGDLILQEAIRRLYVPVSISVMETALASIAVAILMLELVRTRFEPKSVTAGVADAGEGAIAGRAAGPVPRFKPYLIKLPLLAVALAILVLTLTGYVGLGRFISTQIVVTGGAIAVVLVFHLAIRALLGAPGTGIKPLATVLQERAGLDESQSGALTRALALILNAALALIALPLILVTWGYSLPEALSWLKAAMFGFQIGDFRISLVRILLAALLFLALVFATRLAQRWLDTGPLKSQRIDQGIANSVHTAVGYAGFIVAILAAVSYGGIDITNFAIVAGALSVGIGFGLQSIINNFVSGLILLVERPIKVGDRVSVKGQEGFVRRISVRSTEIETGDRASLIVPNSEFIIGTVTNWTHRNALGQVVVKVHVGYQTDPERVRDILQKVGAECPLVLQYPAPGVGFDNFGPNALEFSLSAVVPDVTKASSVQSDLRFRILKAVRAAGIEMPYPQHDVHLRDLDTVRALLMRFAEDRAQKREAAVMDAKKEEPKL
jgi:small-conductance mechanosensitive channel